MENDIKIPQHVQEAEGCQSSASLSVAEVSYNETIGTHQSRLDHAHFFHHLQNVDGDFETFQRLSHVSELLV
jgi:hypothetical protein